jgi:hypothetical protein
MDAEAVIAGVSGQAQERKKMRPGLDGALFDFGSVALYGLP